MTTGDTPSPDAPTEPSKEALQLSDVIATELVVQGIIPDAGGVFIPLRQHLALALDRFRAAGVREGPRYRHKKRGTTYRVVGKAQVQGDDVFAEGSTMAALSRSLPMTDPAKDAERLADVFLKPLTDEQQEYLRALDANARNYDPETIIGDPDAEQRRLTAKVAPDDVERAREFVHTWHLPQRITNNLAAALTAARREGEELRALDEAVIEAARAVDAAWTEFSEFGNHDARLITKLYARLDDLNAALAARDAATGAPGTEKAGRG